MVKQSILAKSSRQSCDAVGEWPGFIRLSPAAARFVANILDQQVTAGAIDTPCEDSFRSMILAARANEIEFHDAAGIPWIEIDFPEDIKRAQQIIAPELKCQHGIRRGIHTLCLPPARCQEGSFSVYLHSKLQDDLLQRGDYRLQSRAVEVDRSYLDRTCAGHSCRNK